MRSESYRQKDGYRSDGRVGVEVNYRLVSNSEWS